MAISTIGCTGNLKHQGVAMQDDSASVVSSDSPLRDAMDTEQQNDLSTAISQRVTAMFNDVYRHYAIIDSLIKTEESLLENEKVNNFDKTKYYSESLKALWDKMPHDDVVIDYDPWTMSQDYDTLVCRNVAVRSVTNKTAIVDVEIFLSRNWPEKTIRLQLVYEKNKTANKDDWFIADFQYNGSMAKEISDYLKEYNQD